MEIIIRRQINSLMNEIFIIRGEERKYLGKSVISAINFDQDGNAYQSDAPETGGQQSKLKPAMILDERDTRKLLAAFSEAAKDRGAVKDNTYLQGKLEGTEKHLEDMRRLVFDQEKEVITGLPQNIDFSGPLKKDRIIPVSKI